MTRIEQHPGPLPKRLLSHVVLATLVATALLAGTRVADAAGTPEQCQAAKLKASSKNAACRLGAMAKLAAGGEMSKYTDALDKCETKFSTAFDKAETKAGPGVCPTEGDTVAVETQIDADTSDLQGVLHAGTRFEANSLTVTDHWTGLEWEKKTGTVGGPVLCSITPCPDPHHVNNAYRWTALAGGTIPDGPAFIEFLGELNECESADGSTVTGGFAGHCDWRLPTHVELLTLQLDPCGAAPCIDPVLGPTAWSPQETYWSSVTSAPTNAVMLGFQLPPFLFVDNKHNHHHVRAVRGGL